VVHRYIHDGDQPAARETFRYQSGSTLDYSRADVTRFIPLSPGGLGTTLVADDDGTLDVNYADRNGQPWFWYRAKEGESRVPIYAPSKNLERVHPFGGFPYNGYTRPITEAMRGTGVFPPVSLSDSPYMDFTPWHAHVLEPDFFVGRRGVAGWWGNNWDPAVWLQYAPENYFNYQYPSGLLGLIPFYGPYRSFLANVERGRTGMAILDAVTFALDAALLYGLAVKIGTKLALRTGATLLTRDVGEVFGRNAAETALRGTAESATKELAQQGMKEGMESLAREGGEKVTYMTEAELAEIERSGVGLREFKLPRTGNLPRGRMAMTTPQGKVILRKGLTRAQQAYYLKHEGVHVFLTPKRGPLLGFRQSLGQSAYDWSAFLQGTEEIIAETRTTGSLRAGWAHAFSGFYKTPIWTVHPLTWGVEGAAMIYGVYRTGRRIRNLFFGENP
jgi:hypothetical protein